MIKLFLFSKIIHALLPIIIVFLNVTIQLFFIRIVKVNYLKSIFIGFFISLLLLLFYEITFFLFNKFNLSYCIINIFNYLLVSFAYFVFLTTAKTSLRVRVLNEIYDVNTGINLKEIYKKYNAKEITRVRISRLINNKQIKYNNGKFFYQLSITLIIALFIDTLKLIFFGREKCLNKYFKSN